MAFTLPLYGSVELTTSVNKLVMPNRFVTSSIYKNVREHSTKQVMVDIIVGRQKIAPFVRRGREAVSVSTLGQRSQMIEPPNIRLKKILDADDLLFTRGAGSLPVQIAGGGNIEQARKKKIATEQADLRHIIDRTTEYLGCRGLLGSYTISTEDGEFAIDFSMPSANKPALTSGAKWDAPTTANPISNIKQWKNVVKKATGKVPTMALMTTTVWDHFFKTDSVQKYLDKLKINVGQIKTDETVLNMGAEKVAHIEGIDFYTYDEYFQNDSGNDESMIPEDKFLLVSPSADYRLHYGAIEDLKAGTAIGRYFSKDWLTEDPSFYNLLVESHPLPVPHQPEANIAATVV